MEYYNHLPLRGEVRLHFSTSLPADSLLFFRYHHLVWLLQYFTYKSYPSNIVPNSIGTLLLLLKKTASLIFPRWVISWGIIYCTYPCYSGIKWDYPYYGLHFNGNMGSVFPLHGRFPSKDVAHSQAIRQVLSARLRDRGGEGGLIF